MGGVFSVNMEQPKHVKRIAWLCTLVYFTSYLLRKNLGIMLVKVCSDMGFAESAFAVVLTGLTVCYGGGQLVSGVLGDKISPQRMIVCGLFAASLANIAIAFTNSILLMTVVWCINGFAHSMLWSPIIKLFTEYLDDRSYSYGTMRLMLGSTFATVFLRLFCPAMLLVVRWKWIMLILALFGVGVSALFALSHKRVFDRSLAVGGTAAKSSDEGEGEKHIVPLPRYALPMTALIVLAIILHGMLREGVDVWMPSFLCETFGMGEENAIFSTVILSAFGMLSFTVFDYLYRRVFRSELLCATFAFSLATAAAAVLFVLTKTGGAAVFSMIMMAIIIGSMSGVNLMLIATVPKRYLKSGRVASFTGMLDAAAYVGAAIATYGFAALFEGFGWSATIFVWVLVAGAGVLFCAVGIPSWRKFRRNYSDTLPLWQKVKN